MSLLLRALKQAEAERDERVPAPETPASATQAQDAPPEHAAASGQGVGGASSSQTATLFASRQARRVRRLRRLIVGLLLAVLLVALGGVTFLWHALEADRQAWPVAEGDPPEAAPPVPDETVDAPFEALPPASEDGASEEMSSSPGAVPVARSGDDAASDAGTPVAPGPVGAGMSPVRQALPARSAGAGPSESGMETAAREPVIRVIRRPLGRRLGDTLAEAGRAARRGELAEARRLFEQVLRAHPRHVGALLGAATLASRLGDRQAALGYYRRVLRLQPDNVAARAGRLTLVSGIGASEWEAEMKRLIERHPRDLHLRVLMAQGLTRASKWREAQAAWFEAYRLAPRNPDLAYNLAVALDRMGKARQAVVYYRKALELARQGRAAFPEEKVLARLRRLEQADE